MRIWSVHPRYLDRQALIACWRETLLAQAVLAGRTKGYTQHPQLERFRATPEPLAAVGAYLAALADEADARGYTLDRTRIDEPDAAVARIDVADGQLDLEWAHLTAKLTARSPDVAERWRAVERPEPHTSFRTVPGPVASWERASLCHDCGGAIRDRHSAASVRDWDTMTIFARHRRRCCTDRATDQRRGVTSCDRVSRDGIGS